MFADELNIADGYSVYVYNDDVYTGSYNNQRVTKWIPGANEGILMAIIINREI